MDFDMAIAQRDHFPRDKSISEPSNRFYTTFTNFNMKYHLMCKVYTDVGGIK